MKEKEDIVTASGEQILFGSSLRTHCLRYVWHTPTKLPYACGGSSAIKQFPELALVVLCLCLKSYTVLMSPNKEETAVHGCSSYLHCSYSGKASCAHACTFWVSTVGLFLGKRFRLSTGENISRISKHSCIIVLYLSTGK